MMRRSRWVVLICMLAATAVLMSLGAWQVRRMHWKEALIAGIESRRHAAPVLLADMLDQWQASADVDYRPVTVSGRLDHAREVYYYTTLNGAVGWNVYTPLALADGGWLIVNRGFVPDALRDPASRAAGQVAGPVTFDGLARDPVVEKPNRFVPENRPDKREFYWKSLPEMAASMRLDGQSALVPFFVDAGPTEVPGGYPRGGTTLVDFPNNHLQYAITWFGLAAACLGVGGYFLLAGGRQAGRAKGGA